MGPLVMACGIVGEESCIVSEYEDAHSPKQRRRTLSDIVRGNDGTDGGRVIVGLRWIRRTGSEGRSFDSARL